MSTICKVVTEGPASKKLSSGVYGFVKGSPEAIFKLLKKENLKLPGFEEKYQITYRRLAEQGQRVLALAYRKLSNEFPIKCADR